MEEDPLKFVVPPRGAGQTLRVFLGDALPLEPEDFVRQLIVSGKVTVDGETSDPRRVLHRDETVAVQGLESARKEYKTEIVRAPVLYEDEHLLVLNKPAGCTVVRERHSESCPFQNGVLEHVRRSLVAQAPSPVTAEEDTTGEGACATQGYRPRAVHRLDRDTTGAVIFVKSRAAELHLTRQFKERTIAKEYMAVVHGEMPNASGTIEAAVASPEHQLERVTIDERFGKAAVTPYEVVERFRGFTLVRATPKTGRRHQVRVHLSHIGYPIVADRVYGGGSSVLLSSFKRGYRRRGMKGEEPEKPLIARPALHASAITFLPLGAERTMRVEAPLARDMEVFLKMLRKYAIGGARQQWADE